MPVRTEPSALAPQVTVEDVETVLSGVDSDGDGFIDDKAEGNDDEEDV